MGRKEDMAKLAHTLMEKKDVVRNIGVVAHIDHGKTTMTDNLVAAAGLMSEELAGKQLVMDSEDQEQARGITINSANISVVTKVKDKDYLINIIDTPGHVDFTGEVIRAMRACDGVIVVVCASEGVMPQTETVLRQALKERAKPILFINKVDRLINELKVTQEDMQQRFVKIIANVNNLIKKNAPEGFEEEWQVNPANGSVCFGSAYHNWAVSVPFMKETRVNFKQVYDFCNEEKQKELAQESPLHKCIFMSVVDHLPTPIDSQKYRIPAIWNGDLDSEVGKAMLACSSEVPFSMMATDVSVDQHAGDIATGRVYSGTIQKGMRVKLIGAKKEVGIQKVCLFMGEDFIEVPSVPAGNIASLIGLKEVFAGETISDREIHEFESFLSNAEPVMTVSIEAKQTKDLPKLITAIKQLTKEDPNLKAHINQDTGEHLLSGMGELHLEVNQYRIENRYKIGVNVSAPIVVYLETIQKDSLIIEGKSPNRHNKFKIMVTPLEKEIFEKLVEKPLEGKIKPKDKETWAKLENFGFAKDEAKKIWMVHNKNVLIDRTRGIQALHEVKELVMQGFKDAMDEGPLAKEKCFGMLVELHDATLHEDAIHRGPSQVLPAITRSIFAAMLSSNAVLFEPKQTLTITVPEDYMGAVSRELSSRRAQITEMKTEGDQTIIIGKAPVKELIGFSQDIRSATQGRAMWVAEYAGYEVLPRELQSQIIREIRTRKGMDPEPKAAEHFMD